MTAPPPARLQTDRCPGLLRPHLAADGALVRVRLPGGTLPVKALRALSRVAALFGDGRLQLTSRGNLQVRGVPVDDEGDVPEELVRMVVSAGLLPSAGHELVRNISCSPFTGRSGGLADLRPLTAELDQVICGTPELAGLPGRFLFALDDGTGDVESAQYDLGVRAVSGNRVAVLAGGTVGEAIPIADAARSLVELALAFLRRRGTDGSWHVRELRDGPDALLRDVGLAIWPPKAGSHQLPAPSILGESPRLGPIRQDDGRMMLSLVVPLGLLTQEQVDVIGAVAEQGSPGGAASVVVTPWRGLLIPDLLQADDLLQVAGAVEMLAAVGLSSDPKSGWRSVSACTGAPGCDKASAATGNVASLLAATPTRHDSLPVHVVACERRCGSPSGPHVEVLTAGPSGFRVSTRGDGSIASTPAVPSVLPALVDFARNPA